jgi:hypothetical protein
MQDITDVYVGTRRWKQSAFETSCLCNDNRRSPNTHTEANYLPEYTDSDDM